MCVNFVIVWDYEDIRIVTSVLFIFIFPVFRKEESR